MNTGRHTPYPWTTLDGQIIGAGLTLGEVHNVSNRVDPEGDVTGNNARLMSAAPFVPHDCGDRNCPGWLLLEVLTKVASGYASVSEMSNAKHILDLLKEGRT